MKYTWNDFDEIFGFTAEQAQGFTPEHLAELCTITIELTLAHPLTKQYKNLTLLQKVDVHRQLFDNLKAEYKATSGSHEIEYHVSGLPHLHGYLTVPLHANHYAYPDDELLRMFAKSIFLKLPKSVYKQFSNAKVDGYLRRFKSPAVVINLKNMLETGWTDYMTKMA